MDKKPSSRIVNLGIGAQPENGEPQDPTPTVEEPSQEEQEGTSVGLDNIIPTVLTMMSNSLKQREVITQNQAVLAQQNVEIIRLLKVIAGEDTAKQETQEDGGQG